MCGILGFSGPRSFDATAFGRALDTMANRGPDDRGTYEEPECILGHRRLAILDLSPTGHQPMSTPDGRYAIVFNGEIYNYRDLRKPLEDEGVAFRSTSDTEVILHLYARQGPSCLGAFRGMFALAIWDMVGKTLFIARDRLGVKPLYVWQKGKSLAFASEVRAIRTLPGGPGDIKPRAVASYLAWGSVPEPKTILVGVEALPAGHWGMWDGRSLKIQPYWAIPEPTGEVRSRGEAIDLLRPILRDAVALRCISDAPLGAFLSGGIDSSSVVSLMREAGQREIRTFSISFPQSPLDEGPYALKVAEQFDTLHTDVSVTEHMVRHELDSFFAAMDQPTCDGFNTYLVSKFARRGGLTVSLSGLGGDELFAGYGTFDRIRRAAPWVRVMPRLAALLGNAAVGNLSGRAAKLQSLALRGGVFDRLYYGSRGLFMPAQIRQLLEPGLAAVLPKDWSPISPYDTELMPGTGPGPKRDGVSAHHATTGRELSLYMRNQLLRDSDVFSMAHGLEIRVPFIDHKLVEAIFRIAPGIIAQKPAKSLLMESLPKPLPRECTHRPKMGFTFPFDSWMRGPWQALAEEECLSESSLLRLPECKKIWRAFRQGDAHWSRPWAIIALKRLFA